MADELRRLRDRFALRTLVDRYAHAIDHRRFDELPELFTPDATLETYDALEQILVAHHEGATEIATQIAGHFRYRSTTHFVGQQFVVIDGDRATGETYCLAHHLFRHDGALTNRLLSIRYDDRYERTGERWAFRSRRLVIDWTHFFALGPPVPLPNPPAAPNEL